MFRIYSLDSHFHAPKLVAIQSDLMDSLQTVLRIRANRALIMKDCAIPTEWFNYVEAMTKKLPKSFDICWVGHSKRTDNKCLTVPDYEWDVCNRNRVDKYLFEINREMVDTGNYPRTACAWVVSRDFVRKFFDMGWTDFSMAATDSSISRFMTVPCIAIECSESEQDPYENIWLRQPQQEMALFKMLSTLHRWLTENQIRYSIIYGSLLGWARNKRVISYDDDFDIIIFRTDFPKFAERCHQLEKLGISVYTYTESKFLGTLKYKLFPTDYALPVSGQEYKWPFLDVFDLDVDETTKTFHDIASQLTIPMKSTKLVEVSLHPYSNQIEPTKISAFEDYESILRVAHGEKWRQNCITSSWNHREERPTARIESCPCELIVKPTKEDKKYGKEGYEPYDPYDSYNSYDSCSTNLSSDRQSIVVGLALLVLAIFVGIIMRKICQ